MPQPKPKKLTVVSDRQAVRDAALLVYPPEGTGAGWDELCEAVRLLLIAHNRVEREVIGYRLVQKLTLREVAGRLEITDARVRELLASLRRREKELSEQARHKDTLALLMKKD